MWLLYDEIKESFLSEVNLEVSGTAELLRVGKFVERVIDREGQIGVRDVGSRKHVDEIFITQS